MVFAIIDREVVALADDGRPSLNVLQNYNHAGTPLQFYVLSHAE
ncbi:MAG TPA: hypothetical protein VMF32_09805 [Xanthobacteraceae bacterium]|nr:hypothetical protein [Xanthobacteraceae bacterium]